MEVMIRTAGSHPDVPAIHFFIAFGTMIVLGIRKPVVPRPGLPLPRLSDGPLKFMSKVGPAFPVVALVPSPSCIRKFLINDGRLTGTYLH